MIARPPPVALTSEQAYRALHCLRGASGGKILLGNLTPALPTPEGFSGRLPIDVEAAWYTLLKTYLDEYQIAFPLLLERLERAGRYLAAGGMRRAFQGASGLSVPSLCTPRTGLFVRLMTEAADWDGLPLQDQGPSGPSPVIPEDTLDATWAAYASAYAQRYSRPPLRNQQATSLIRQFVAHVGAEVAPSVAAHYLANPSAYYVSAMHPLALLVRDHQKLHTEWETGRRINATQARREEATEANPFVERARLAEERERDERTNENGRE